MLGALYFSQLKKKCPVLYGFWYVIKALLANNLLSRNEPLLYNSSIELNEQTSDKQAVWLFRAQTRVCKMHALKGHEWYMCCRQ